jgi:hypothetical protein
MRGAIHPLSQYVFMAWCLVTHRDKFTFFYLWYNNVVFHNILAYGLSAIGRKECLGIALILGEVS